MSYGSHINRIEFRGKVVNAGFSDTDWGGVLFSGEGFGQPWAECGLRALVEMMNECLR